MARKPMVIEKKRPELLVSANEAEEKLLDRINKGKELFEISITDSVSFRDAKNQYSKWDNFNVELLTRIFTTDEYQNEYSYCVSCSFSLYDEPSFSEKVHNIREDIIKKIHVFESLIERLELIPLSNEIKVMEVDESIPKNVNKKVFVVHGRDEVAKASLEILLHEMGLETIVLHRQADEGQTIIEKFEKHSDVGYAFILLTPDEIAYFTHEDSLPDADRKKEKRARPNVIFEFGYFVGRLGRNKVCCVYTGDVSLPSDVSSMIYKKYISSVEEVAYGIQKDLKAVGILS